MNLNYIRPSTIARVGEDTIINGFGHIGHGLAAAGRGLKRFKHNVGIEMTARSLARIQRRLEKESAMLASMTQAEIKRATADQQRILKRTAELRSRDRDVLVREYWAAQEANAKR